MRVLKKKLLFFVVFFSLVLCLGTTSRYVLAWSNGGYSADPTNPDYGTHDWIAEHALEWLPESEKEWIMNNLISYLYGTELPDNPNPDDGIGDTTKHHVYFSSDESLNDDSAAVRAQEEYNKALSYLGMNQIENAAKTLGIMTHYIADMSVFGHVMGSSTEWGSEVHHSDYENYVNSRTNSYNDEFDVYLLFDGSLDNVTAYEAATDLAFDTTFDVDGDLSCVWMDDNYDWSDSTFRNRCGESLNLAVNSVADVIHTLSVGQQENGNDYVVINEVESNPPGNDNYLDVEEWIELYNPTTNDVDLSGWTLSTTHGTTVTISIPQSTVLAAYGYLVLSRGSQWLDNDDESVVLSDSGGTEIDRTPTLNDNANSALSWQRYPNGEDNWEFRLSTKGSSNGRDTTPPIISVQSPENEQFYPDNNVSLTFSVNEDTDWMGYSLNGEANVTISGSIILNGLSDGEQNVIVYASDLEGNIGASSSILFIIDTTPPIIESVSQNPSRENVQEDEVEVTAIIGDNICKQLEVVLNYSTNNGAWQTISMIYSDEMCTANIPAFSFGTNVTYVICAEDNAGNTISTEEMGYDLQYSVIPEFPSWAILPVLLIASVIVILAKRKISKKTNLMQYFVRNVERKCVKP